MKENSNHIIDNDYFWLYFFSTCFPNALDENEDISLSDFIYSEYDCKAAEQWVDELVQYSEEVVLHNDGYVNDPNYIELVLERRKFVIAFHPCDTLFYLDGALIGKIGGHFKLRTLSWTDYYTLISNSIDSRISLLLLPILALNKEQIPEIEKIIKKGMFYLKFKSKDIDYISKMIINGLL